MHLWIKRFWIVCAVGFGILSAPAFASAACLASVALPNFTVSLMDPPVNYRVDVDNAGMVKVAGESGMAGLKGEIPYGLTIGRYDLEVTVDAESLLVGNIYCAQLRAAHVEIGLRQLDVLVDRQFPVHSCQRDAVLDHEDQHVAVFREAVQYYLPVI